MIVRAGRLTLYTLFCALSVAGVCAYDRYHSPVALAFAVVFCLAAFLLIPSIVEEDK